VINDANAAGQNFDDGAPGKNHDLHDPNKFDVNALLEDVTGATREATEELVPKAPRRVQRGRKASARTEGLREQRMKLMSANKNRNHPEVVAINDDVNESCRRDCRDHRDWRHSGDADGQPRERQQESAPARRAPRRPPPPAPRPRPARGPG